MTHAQLGPLETVSLRPPLCLEWSYRNAIPNPLVCPDALFAKTCRPDGLAKLDLAGHELWRRKDGLYNAGVVGCGESLLAVAERERPPEQTFYVIQASDGQTRSREPVRFTLGALLADEKSFVGVASGPDDEDFKSTTLGRVAIGPGLPVIWQIPTRDARRKFGEADVWDAGVAYADGCIFAGRGSRTVCLDAATGKEMWSGSMEAVGTTFAPGKRQPIVVGGRVVVTGGDGLIAFDCRTGGVAWTFPEAGWKRAYGDQLYFLGESYAVIDIPSGEARVLGRMAEKIAAKYGAKSSGQWRGGMNFTAPAVSETHVFFGDDSGRLWAIERETGEPVWYDQPKNISGYLAATPQIVGNRLYITSFSMDPRKPQALYCYEQVDA